MMRAKEPLTKVTMNFFTKDLIWFKDRNPFNYSEEVRKVLRNHIGQTEAWRMMDKEWLAKSRQWRPVR